jgi:hypothetical protein
MIRATRTIEQAKDSSGDLSVKLSSWSTSCAIFGVKQLVSVQAQSAKTSSCSSTYETEAFRACLALRSILHLISHAKAVFISFSTSSQQHILPITNRRDDIFGSAPCIPPCIVLPHHTNDRDVIAMNEHRTTHSSSASTTTPSRSGLYSSLRISSDRARGASIFSTTSFLTVCFRGVVTFFFGDPSPSSPSSPLPSSPTSVLAVLAGVLRLRGVTILLGVVVAVAVEDPAEAASSMDFLAWALMLLTRWVMALAVQPVHFRQPLQTQLGKLGK